MAKQGFLVKVRRNGKQEEYITFTVDVPTAVEAVNYIKYGAHFCWGRNPDRDWQFVVVPVRLVT